MNKLLAVALILIGGVLNAAAQTDFSAREAAAEPLKALQLHKARVNEIDIAYRVLGEETAPPVVMIMGLGSSHVLWGYNLPAQLAAAGYRVILFDNRDVGGSQRFDEYGDPLIWWQLLKDRFGFEVDAAYEYK